MAHDIHAGIDHLAGTGRKNRCVGPYEKMLAVRFVRDAVDEKGRQVRVDLDRRGTGAACLGDREPHIGVAGNGAHPRHGAGHGTLRGIGRPRILEEFRTRHEGRVVNVWSWRFPNSRRAGKIGEFARIAGHVAHGGYPAIHIAAQERFCEFEVRPGRQMHVGVDQAGNRIGAAHIHDARICRALGD